MMRILVMKEIALTEDRRGGLETMLRVLRGPRRQGVAGDRRKLHNDEIYNAFSPPYEV
jgi:hypothetical protein